MIDFGFYHGDCMDYLKSFPDKYFGLAIVDPPYGLGITKIAYANYDGKSKSSRNAKANNRDYRTSNHWDIKPTQEYFDELLRVSQKQIVWGGKLLCRYVTTE